MWQPVDQTVETSVVFWKHDASPRLLSFRWHRRKYEVLAVEQIRVATTERPLECGPSTAPRHFSTRWHRDSSRDAQDLRIPEQWQIGSMQYLVRTPSNRCSLRYEPSRLQWVLEAVDLDLDWDLVQGLDDADS